MRWDADHRETHPQGFLDPHPNAEEPLLAWYREVEKADWEGPRT